MKVDVTVRQALCGFKHYIRSVEQYNIAVRLENNPMKTNLYILYRTENFITYRIIFNRSLFLTDLLTGATFAFLLSPARSFSTARSKWSKKRDSQRTEIHSTKEGTKVFTVH